jgi:glycosyltransferase involved in cell wall biosynthesis
MKILTIGTDRQLFTPGSQVGKRAVAYGRFFEQYHQVVFALKKHNLEEAKLSDNTWVYPTGSTSRFLYIVESVRLGSKLLKQNPGQWIISAQDPFETGLVACWLAWRHKLPFQIQIHTDFLSSYFARQSFLNRIRVWLARRILPRANQIRVVSERIKRSIVQAGIKTKNEIIVLPIVVNQSNQAGQASDTESLKIKYPQFSKIILVVSRLEPEKNVGLAIKVFKQVTEDYPQAGMIIVGSGSAEDKLKDLTGQLGLKDKVIFVGQQNGLEEFYRMADTLLNTSNYEGYGLVLAEARLAGLPVVSTDVGIAQELLGSEFVCPVGDEECLAKKTNLVLSGQISQQTIPAGLIEADFERYVERYANLLKQCQSR